MVLDKPGLPKFTSMNVKEALKRRTVVPFREVNVHVKLYFGQKPDFTCMVTVMSRCVGWVIRTFGE